MAPPHTRHLRRKVPAENRFSVIQRFCPGICKELSGCPSSSSLFPVISHRCSTLLKLSTAQGKPVPILGPRSTHASPESGPHLWLLRVCSELTTGRAPISCALWQQGERLVGRWRCHSEESTWVTGDLFWAFVTLTPAIHRHTQHVPLIEDQGIRVKRANNCSELKFSEGNKSHTG